MRVTVRGASKLLLVAALTAASFATAWEPRLLQHRLLAAGEDGAGASDVVAGPDAPVHPYADSLVAEAPAAAEPQVLPARAIDVPQTVEHPAYRVYAPAGPNVPRRALLALHGMDDTGPSLAATLLDRAQAQDWVVVAPTIRYGEWKDPLQLTQEELTLAPQLVTLLESVTAETGVLVTGKALVFGFSRGSQAALRLTTFYPARIEAVAAFSAGTYTLPAAQVRTVSGATVTAVLPYGVADLEARRGSGVDMEALRQVRVLVGVAAGDTREGEVPRQWDSYLGKSRLERAQTFTAALQRLGIPARLVVVAGTVHGITAQMPEQGVAFLAQPG
jgi:hypothetical protein